MSDPTVNPGQGVGTRTIHGLVLRLQDRGYVIRDAKNHEVSVVMDEETTGDKEVSPGGYIETKLTRQAQAITIMKQSPPEEPAMKRSSTKWGGAMVGVAYPRSDEEHCQSDGL